MRKFYQKLSDRKKKLAAENRKGLQYSSGMGGPFAEDEVATAGTKRKREYCKKQMNDSLCRHCGGVGHTRTNCKHCLKNNKYMAESHTGGVIEEQPAREVGMK